MVRVICHSTWNIMSCERLKFFFVTMYIFYRVLCFILSPPHAIPDWMFHFVRMKMLPHLRTTTSRMLTHTLCSTDVRTEKRRKSGDMHTKLTLDGGWLPDWYQYCALW